MNHSVRFVNPSRLYRMIKKEVDDAYFEIMENGDLIDRGQLKSFEENLAKFVGTRYAVGLNSGYDALHMSLRAAGVGPGDEVIVPAHTFVATCSAVVNVGATPVLVDVGKDFNIDCDRIEEAIKNRRAEGGPAFAKASAREGGGGQRSSIKAIIPVHLSGWMADMTWVMEIAQKYGLVVIEDACQSLGASQMPEGGVQTRLRQGYGALGVRGKRAETIGQRSEGGSQKAERDPQISQIEKIGGGKDGGKKMAGAWGLTGCWSFYPFKILGGYGDGGAITTDDPEVAEFATRMRYNGEDRETGEYHGHGFTCLLDNMQAAFLDVKLRYLPQWIERRKRIAERYREALVDIEDLLLPHYDDPRRDHVYQNYTVRAKQGNAFSEYLKANGVEVLTQFRKPYYRHEALKLEDWGFPETEALSREVCSLPMCVELEDEEVEYVIQVVRRFYGK